MEKRVLLAAALCLAIMFLWYRIFPPPIHQGPTSSPPSVEASTGSRASVLANTPQVPEPGATLRIPGQVQPLVPAEQMIAVERPGLYRAVVTSYGAAIRQYELLDHKYYSRDSRELVLRNGKPEIELNQSDEPTSLIPTYQPSLEVHFPESGFTLPSVQAWVLESNEPVNGSGRRLVFTWASPDVQLKKTLLFAGQSYQVGMTLEVKNLKAGAVSHHFEVGLHGFQDPAQKPGGMFSARVPQNEVMWDRSGKMESLNLEALQGNVPVDKLRGDLRWIGIGQQYFLQAIAMEYGAQIGEKQGHASANHDGAMAISAEYAERTLQPLESAIYSATFYAGPKLPELLEAVNVKGVSSGLKTSINYTLGFLARPLLWVLRLLYELLHSWALAIVVLTVLVKLVTLYPSHKSIKSMKAMGDLKPEIDALKDKYGEDKQRFNMELMELYKKHDVNPVGGCLPMLLQMPIYFALYSMLGNAVELYRVQFLWIKDLTAADPYFVLPLLTGGMMFLQTKLTPAPSDPQQKMMSNLMPVMFTVFSIFLPAGLTLYIMTNTVLGMIQQGVINRNQKRSNAVVAKK